MVRGKAQGLGYNPASPTSGVGRSSNGGLCDIFGKYEAACGSGRSSEGKHVAHAPYQDSNLPSLFSARWRLWKAGEARTGRWGRRFSSLGFKASYFLARSYFGGNTHLLPPLPLQNDREFQFPRSRCLRNGRLNSVMQINSGTTRIRVGAKETLRPLIP